MGRPAYLESLRIEAVQTLASAAGTRVSPSRAHRLLSDHATVTDALRAALSEPEPIVTVLLAPPIRPRRLREVGRSAKQLAMFVLGWTAVVVLHSLKMIAVAMLLS